MRAFSILGAAHYCNSFQPMANLAWDSVEDFSRQQSSRLRQISEGTSLFDQFRVISLRETERCLFFAASHYRRALDLMIPSTIHWAHVTLYYGTWFAAKALLSMFGCQVLGKHIIEAGRSAPGSQSLVRRPIGNGQGQQYFSRSGSHQRFWEAFYSTVPSITHFADAKYASLLSPVSQNEMWLIEQRNRINYKVADSFKLRDAFASTLLIDPFPNNLPKELNTQYQVCEGLLMISYSFAVQFGLATDSLNSLGQQLTFKDKVRQHIYDATIPNLVGLTQGNQVF